jgi:hypothetical protein
MSHDRNGITRRQLLRLTMTVSAAAAGVAACKGAPKELVCSDTTGLAVADVQLRKAVAYVDKSANPEKTCLSCEQFVVGPEGRCATCKVVKGGVHPQGTCNVWQAKGAAAPPIPS